jgi:hypothetical protein
MTDTKSDSWNKARFKMNGISIASITFALLRWEGRETERSSSGYQADKYKVYRWQQKLTS